MKNEDGKEIGWVMGGVPLAAVGFFVPWLIAIALVVAVAIAGLVLIGTVLGGGGSGGMISTAIRRQQQRDDTETAVHNAMVRAESRHFWKNHSHPWL
ncbi:hypothetical protein [Saccharothrix sp. ALI-22-I]|uniref:hypothetical protein n=1 Tax=Saccharothrix sp. ALI-22-I TaxID=1933778 RepID=UPI00097BE651|nr:hypothetical protein [Saccharothrix sp. ALI-22-I]